MAQRHPFDEAHRQSWKTYPVRLLSAGESHCCGQPRLLVQSMGGGFVTANCSGCGDRGTLAVGDFEKVGNQLWVACPQCRKRMKAEYVPGSGNTPNYGFLCGTCQLYIWLADLLPKWEDVS